MYVEISAVKCLEVFNACWATGHKAFGDNSDKLDVFQVREQEVYVKGVAGEGWVPVESLKITKQRLSVQKAAEMSLKLIVRTENEEREVGLEYTGMNVASVKVGVTTSRCVMVGVVCGNEVVGFVRIDPQQVLKSAGNAEYVNHEVEVFTHSYLVNYLVVEMQVATKNDRTESALQKNSFLATRSSLSEKFILMCRVVATVNGVGINGQLHLSTHNFFITCDAQIKDWYTKVWVQSIRSLKLTPKNLTIVTKDLRIFEILSDDIKLLSDSLNSLLSNTIQFASNYFLSINKEIPDFIEPYPIFQSFQRLKSDFFRISYLNIDYKLCDTYPSLLCFPAHISDTILKKVAEFRSKNRLPTVTWHKSATALYRSSQPKLGLGNRSQDDEYFFSLARIKYVIDARPGMNAKANRLKGKGYERESDYGIKLKFMGIQNIHHVTRSFDAFLMLGNKKEDFWQSVGESKWMSHIILLLEAALCCSNHLVIEKVSILVHCSDGWDRTSQICALTQLLIDPYCRTLAGFQEVVNKDWLAFGHKFYDRTFGAEFSPIFLLFLDCVHQVVRQFPEEFEFTQEFLLELADISIRGVHSAFLANCEKERNDLLMRTQSLWTECKSNWKNENFSQGYFLILPVSTLAHKLSVWQFFTRYS